MALFTLEIYFELCSRLSHQPILLDMKKRGVDPNYWEIPDKVGHFNLIGHKVIANEITKKMIGIAIEDKH